MLLQWLRIVRKFTVWSAVNLYRLHSQSLQQQGDGNSSGGIYRIHHYPKPTSLDRFGIDQGQVQNLVDMDIDIRIIAKDFSKIVNLRKFYLTCFGNIKDILPFGGIEKFPFIIQEF